MKSLKEKWKDNDFYPSWVCLACGGTALENPRNTDKKLKEYSTWHKGICEMCGEEKTITEPRDFGYPVFVKDGRWLEKKVENIFDDI